MDRLLSVAALCCASIMGCTQAPPAPPVVLTGEPEETVADAVGKLVEVIGVSSLDKEGDTVRSKSFHALTDYYGSPPAIDATVRVRGTLRKNDPTFGYKYRIVYATWEPAPPVSLTGEREENIDDSVGKLVEVMGIASFDKDGDFVKTQSFSVLTDYDGPPPPISTVARIRGTLRRNDDRFGCKYRIVHAKWDAVPSPQQTPTATTGK